MTKIIEPSGLYYPNKMGRIFLEALREVVGEARYSAILMEARLVRYLHDLPPDNMDQSFDFAHMSAINAAIDTLYGEASGQAIGLQVGRKCFKAGIQSFGVGGL
jgi:hypothetical protein